MKKRYFTAEFAEIAEHSNSSVSNDPGESRYFFRAARKNQALQGRRKNNGLFIFKMLSKRGSAGACTVRGRHEAEPRRVIPPR